MKGLCAICGIAITRSKRRSFCGPECAKQGHRQRNDMHKNECLQVKIKVEPRPKREYKSPISDEEQRKLNIQIDDRSHPHKPAYRHLRPGDPDFDAVAAQITSLDKCRGTERHYTIFADLDTKVIGRRSENTKELR